MSETGSVQLSAEGERRVMIVPHASLNIPEANDSYLFRNSSLFESSVVNNILVI